MMCLPIIPNSSICLSIIVFSWFWSIGNPIYTKSELVLISLEQKMYNWPLKRGLWKAFTLEFWGWDGGRQSLPFIGRLFLVLFFSPDHQQLPDGFIIRRPSPNLTLQIGRILLVSGFCDAYRVEGTRRSMILRLRGQIRFGWVCTSSFEVYGSIWECSICHVEGFLAAQKKYGFTAHGIPMIRETSFDSLYRTEFVLFGPVPIPTSFSATLGS